MSDNDRTIVVGDRHLALRLTLKSLRLIGEKVGIRVRPGHVNEDLLEQELGLEVFGVVLWACLQHHEPPPSLDDVEQSVDQDNFTEVMERFFALFGATSQAQEIRAAMTGALAPSEEETNEKTAAVSS